MITIGNIDARVIEPPYGISNSLTMLNTVASAIIILHSVSTNRFVLALVFILPPLPTESDDALRLVLPWQNKKYRAGYTSAR
jgi:hypothetical protein